MGYLKIPNLYKDKSVLAFHTVYALEKIHGTSAHIGWDGGQVYFFAGEQKEKFPTLFDHAGLESDFAERFGEGHVRVHGEFYGGKIQGMRNTYGPNESFIAFDVCVGDKWLDVPRAAAVVEALGLPFVQWWRVTGGLSELDMLRDRPSSLAIERGMGEQKAEGIVIRPPFECRRNNGKRVIAKHKRADFRETATVRAVGPSPEVLREAQAVADEWVTAMRMEHVLQQLQARDIDTTQIQAIGEFIKAMVADVCEEGEGEFIETKRVRKAISAKAAQMFKAKLALA